jgi:hypothetical protein
MLDTPIVINNRDRLTTTRRLANKLSELGYKNITILDNNSTYPLLLEWYKECSYTVVMLGQNMGQLAIYDSGHINLHPRDSWIAYTDSDVELNKETPSHFIEVMIQKAERYHFNKIGLALQIDDLPNTEYANWVRGWEAKFWIKALEEDLYIADVDTTFSLIKVGLPFQYHALRIAGKFTAKHAQWYEDHDNLTEEEQYIIDHSHPVYSTTKRAYNTYKTNKL